ncbi:MAG TPA: hypothetical protein VNW29_04815 [Candidatus Sulfotelmatobacter sp.]|jgi:hypothetical protein|nr:hypothetical protein [Candidatus Sulfotelmatobacter sp.]
MRQQTPKTIAKNNKKPSPFYTVSIFPISPSLKFLNHKNTQSDQIAKYQKAIRKVKKELGELEAKGVKLCLSILRVPTEIFMKLILAD